MTRGGGGPLPPYTALGGRGRLTTGEGGAAKWTRAPKIQRIQRKVHRAWIRETEREQGLGNQALYTAWPHSMHTQTSESILSQWEWLTAGISYLNQSEWHRARRPSSEASTKHWEKRMKRLTHQRKIQNREGIKVQWTGWKATKTYRPDYQTDDGGPQRSLEVFDSLLHGGQDSSRHICM